MRVLWTEKRYNKESDRLLDRYCVNKGGLDIYKEVLWVSVDQRTAELLAIKVWGWKKNFVHQLGLNPICPRWADWQNSFFQPLTLMACSSVALWPTETHSTSLERFKPLLLTQFLFKSLSELLVYLISVQSTLISIVLN